MNVDWKQLFLEGKRLFGYKPNEVMGLDIGSSAVKIVQMRRDDSGYRVTAAGIAEIANATGDDEGREADTVRAISDCLRSSRPRTRFAVCGVCGPEVAVRNFEFPALPPEEIEGAVRLEAEEICPFSMDDGVVDYQLIPDGDDSVSGILVAATNKLIERKNRLAKNASVGNVLMDVDGLALLNCFRGLAGEYEKYESGRTRAILNVGGSFTTLVIMGEDGLPFVRDMAYGGDDIVRQIASEHKVSTETVSQALSAPGGSSGPQLAALAGSLARASQKLADDIAETLRYYTAHTKSSVVEKIFVCGGFARVEGFIELLNNQLPAAAVLWNPFDEIANKAEKSCGDILREHGPAMAVAAGLAMRSI